jgi:hypothetical protein
MTTVLAELVTGLASDFKPEVEKIESSIATTKDHYADYMVIISIGKTETAQKLIALALLQAGANQDGIFSAKMVLGL